MVAVSNLPRMWAALLLLCSVMLGGCAGVTAGPSLQEQIEALMKEGQQLYANKK